MTSRRVFALLLPLIPAGVAGPAHAASKWLRIRSPHFLLVGDAGEGSIREVARRVEAFRETMERSLPGVATALPVPTVIIVFGSDQSFAPVKPLFQGKPLEHIGGYFQGGEDTNFIAVNIDGYNEGDRRGVFYAESWALTHSRPPAVDKPSA